LSGCACRAPRGGEPKQMSEEEGDSAASGEEEAPAVSGSHPTKGDIEAGVGGALGVPPGPDLRWFKNKSAAAVSPAGGADRRKGVWRQEEDNLLVAAVNRQFDMGLRKVSWPDVAKCVPHRSCKQCRERWVNHLNPEVIKKKWTPEEDAKLIEVGLANPMKWALIARHIVGRTENQVKVRWKILNRMPDDFDKGQCEDEEYDEAPPTPTAKVSALAGPVAVSAPAAAPVPAAVSASEATSGAAPASASAAAAAAAVAAAAAAVAAASVVAPPPSPAPPVPGFASQQLQQLLELARLREELGPAYDDALRLFQQQHHQQQQQRTVRELSQQLAPPVLQLQQPIQHEQHQKQRLLREFVGEPLPSFAAWLAAREEGSDKVVGSFPPSVSASRLLQQLDKHDGASLVPAPAVFSAPPSGAIAAASGLRSSDSDELLSPKRRPDTQLQPERKRPRPASLPVPPLPVAPTPPLPQLPVLQPPPMKQQSPPILQHSPPVLPQQSPPVLQQPPGLQPPVLQLPLLQAATQPKEEPALTRGRDEPWSDSELLKLHVCLARHGRSWRSHVEADVGTRDEWQCRDKVLSELAAGRMQNPSRKNKNKNDEKSGPRASPGRPRKLVSGNFEPGTAAPEPESARGRARSATADSGGDASSTASGDSRGRSNSASSSDSGSHDDMPAPRHRNDEERSEGAEETEVQDDEPEEQDAKGGMLHMTVPLKKRYAPGPITFS
jgi:hypothetical protein